MKNVSLIKFRDITDPGNNVRPRGHLTPIESMTDVPFEIKRIYYLTKVPEETTRGYHSHKNLEQVLICVNGEIKVLVDDGHSKDIINLNDATTGLYIGPMVWREMFDFSPGSVLLVLASEHYNETDYIRDYMRFVDSIK